MYIKAAIRNRDFKLIYRLDYNVLPLAPSLELYAVADLRETNDLFCTGLSVGNLLLSEMIKLWCTQGFDPLAGSCP